MVKAMLVVVMPGVMAARLASADSRTVAMADPAPVVGGESTDAASGTIGERRSTELHAVRDADAASDRGYGLSTAIALDAGQLDLSLRTAFEHGSMLSTAAGLGHGLELSFSVGYGRTLGTAYTFGAKAQFVDDEDFAFALDADVSLTRDEADLPEDATLWAVDAKATRVTRYVVATGALGVLRASDMDEVPAVPFVEGSLLIGSGPVRPLLEAFSFFGLYNLAFAGLRCGGTHVAFDLGAGVGGSFRHDSNDDTGVALMLGLSVRP